MNKVNKNIKILTSIIYILCLIMIFIIVFQYTHPKEVTNLEYERNACDVGVYYSIMYYNNMTFNASDYEFLLVEVCDNWIYNNKDAYYIDYLINSSKK